MTTCSSKTNTINNVINIIDPNNDNINIVNDNNNIIIIINNDPDIITNYIVINNDPTIIINNCTITINTKNSINPNNTSDNYINPTYNITITSTS